MTYGLLSFGAHLGDAIPVSDVVGDFCDDPDRVLGYGYDTVHRCPAGVGLTDLAVSAAQRALDAGGVDPAEVDLVVLAITDIPEYLYWDAAASVAHRLGADRAEAVLLTQACTAGVVALDATAGKFATHPRYATGLLVAANRTCDEYWNRFDTQPMVFSDGAAAAVVRRDHPRLRWLATEVRTEGRFADLYRLDAGGAAAPFSLTGTDADTLRARDAWSVMEHFDYNAERFEEFVELIDDNTEAVVAAACERAGAKMDELARLILLNDNQAGIAAVAARLKVPVAQTNAALAREYGHLGAADQLFCLGRMDEAGDLAPGDLVAMVSRGRGMHWACTVLRV